MKRWILACLVAACAIAVALALSLRKPGPANLLIISLDTVRPDHLGCYGSAGAATPNIDRLAAEGVSFDDALTGVPLTVPSHTSLLTGLSPLSHGVRDNANFKLEGDFVTIAEVLRANGYSTGAAIGAYVLDSVFGLAQGFEFYDDDLPGEKQSFAFGYPERPAADVTAAAVKWLEGAREPFFFFAHYYDAHAPYTPPGKYGQVFADQPYDGEIAYADEQVGALLRFLEERKVLDRTLVVIVSDHGEGLGDHGEPTHGLLLYDTTLKVVFIVRPPEDSPLAKAAAGTRCGQPVMLTDVFPTVFEMLGLQQTGQVDGRSLVPAMAGRPLPSQVSYIEALSPYFSYRWSPLRGIRFNQWKYVFGPDQELYNLEDDPQELANLAVSAPERVAEMKAALMEAAREEPRARASRSGMSAEEARKLRALGYVSPSPTPVPEISDFALPDPKRMIHLVAEYLEPGNTAFEEGNLDLALEMFTRFTEADPGNPEGYLHRGRVLHEIGDYAEAVRAYDRVLEIDPVNSGAFFHLGIIAQAQGQPDQALAHYRKALDLVPDSPEALANIGSALLEKGLRDSAVAVLHKAVAGNPHHTVALTNLGLAYAADMPDSAVVYFRRVLAIDPADVKALVNCAAIFLGRADADSAAAYFERALEAAPGDPRILVNLGGVYRQQGLLDRAAQSYEQALREEPDNVLALFGLAGVRMSQGNRDQAAALIRQILRIAPDFQPAARAARRLGIS